VLFVKGHLNGVKNGQKFGKKLSTVLMHVEEKETNIANFIGCAK
tara:strand:- start:108 stop:239 length:132 start_codon:yes stop_codon:yes gene_type:complete